MQRAQIKSADRSINIEFSLYALDDPGVWQGNPTLRMRPPTAWAAPIAVGSKLKTATTGVSKWRVFDAHGLVLVEFGDPFIGVSDVQHQCLSMAVEHLLRTCAGLCGASTPVVRGFDRYFVVHGLGARLKMPAQNGTPDRGGCVRGLP